VSHDHGLDLGLSSKVPSDITKLNSLMMVNYKTLLCQIFMMT